MGDGRSRTQSDLTGELLEGRYRVERAIGRGGMGSVWLANDEKVRRSVVVKVPDLAFLEQPGFRERFFVETRSLTELDHPHIVKVYDTGSFDNVPFLVLQYLPGGSLKELLDRSDGRMDAHDLLAWLKPVAEALDFIHQRRVIHRDVKPGNILFDDARNAYLADFGIAKALGHEDPGITRTGMSPGSPAYVAPEAATPSSIGPAYDQYSLAVVVYQLLAGALPHSGETPLEIYLRKTRDAPRPLQEIAPDVPVDVGATVMRALAIDPAQRFRSCSSFVRSFEQGIGTRPGVREKKGDSTILSGGAAAAARAAAAKPGKLEKPGPLTKSATRLPLPRTIPTVAVLLIGLLVVAGAIGYRVWFKKLPGGGDDSSRVDASAAKDVTPPSPRAPIRWRDAGPFAQEEGATALVDFGEPVVVRDASGARELARLDPGPRELKLDLAATRSAEPAPQTVAFVVADLAGNTSSFSLEASVYSRGARDAAHEAAAKTVRDRPPAFQLEGSASPLFTKERELALAGQVEAAFVGTLTAAFPGTSLSAALPVGANGRIAATVVLPEADGDYELEVRDPQGRRLAARRVFVDRTPPRPRVAMVVGDAPHACEEALEVDLQFDEKVELRAPRGPSPKDPLEIVALPARGPLKVQPPTVVGSAPTPFELTFVARDEAGNEATIRIPTTLHRRAAATRMAELRRSRPDALASWASLGEAQRGREAANWRRRVAAAAELDDADRAALQAELAWKGDEAADPASAWKLPADFTAIGELDAETALPTRIRHEPTKIELALIPAGRFTLGAPDGDSFAEACEKPAHAVELTRPCYLGVTEVTNEQYALFDPRHDSGSFDGNARLPLNGRRQPVVSLAVADVEAFCRKFGFVLPTEAQWERAARGSAAADVYAWGAAIDARKPQLNCSDRSLAALTGKRGGGVFVDGAAASSEVARFPRNSFGLFDMNGNVEELCRDTFVLDAYASAGAVALDPVPDPVIVKPGGRHVTRGGSFDSPPELCRTSARGHVGDAGLPTVGFRVALEVGR